MEIQALLGLALISGLISALLGDGKRLGGARMILGLIGIKAVIGIMTDALRLLFASEGL
ncbi:MAG: hypothetical protein IJC48_03925 [Clostridia bacterium]|nr:hypothetical protein [Clostridia bacterium]